MARLGQTARRRRADWVKEYVLGLGLGTAAAVYGLVALWTKHSFLPGLKGGNSTVSGAHGAAIAVAYLTSGLYLVLRFCVHKRCRRESRRARVYLAENALLLVLIAALAYVLWQVGAVG